MIEALDCAATAMQVLSDYPRPGPEALAPSPATLPANWLPSARDRPRARRRPRRATRERSSARAHHASRRRAPAHPDRRRRAHARIPRARRESCRSRARVACARRARPRHPDRPPPTHLAPWSSARPSAPARRREREDGARRVQRDQCKHVTDAGAYVLGAMQRLGHERRDRACRRQPQSAPRDRAHVSAVIARRHHAAPVVMPSRSLSWIGGRS